MPFTCQRRFPPFSKLDRAKIRIDTANAAMPTAYPVSWRNATHQVGPRIIGKSPPPNDANVVRGRRLCNYTGIHAVSFTRALHSGDVWFNIVVQAGEGASWGASSCEHTVQLNAISTRHSLTFCVRAENKGSPLGRIAARDGITN